MASLRTHIALSLLFAVAPASVAFAGSKSELSVSAGLDSAYDGNVFNGRGPDFVNRVDPHASFRLTTERIKLDAAYDLGLWTYAYGKADNSINHHALGSIELRATRRLTIKLDDEFTRAEDPGFLSRFAVVAPQIGISDNIAEVSFGYNITRRLYGNLGYTFHHTTFDPYTPQQIAEGLLPLYDGDEHDVQAGATYRLTRVDDLRTFARIQAFTAGPQSESAERWALGMSYSPTLGFRHQFLQQLELSGDAGPVFYQALADSAQIPGATGSGITWRLGTRLRWYTPTWRGTVAYTHDLLGATGIGSAVWADYAYAQVGYHWIERLDTYVRGGLFRNGQAVDRPVSYDGWTAEAIIEWHVANNFRLGAYYTLRWQEVGPGAIPPGATRAQFPNVTRNIVGLRLLAVLGADARPPRKEVHE